MNYRSFGSTDLQVSEIGLGCSNIGGGAFYKDERESLRVLHRAFELGITFYDTAELYGYGHSEELIGRAFKVRRSQIIIASKVGMMTSWLGRMGKTLLPILQPIRQVIQPWKDTLRRVSKQRQDFSSAHIRKAIEQLLRRLHAAYRLFRFISTPQSSNVGD